MYTFIFPYRDTINSTSHCYETKQKTFVDSATKYIISADYYTSQFEFTAINLSANCPIIATNISVLVRSPYQSTFIST